MDKGIEQAIADGKYYWEMVFSYDNGNNNREIVHKYSTIRKKKVRAKDFIESKFHVASNYTFNSKASTTVKFEGLGEGSGSVSHNFHIETAYELEKNSETETVTDDEFKEERSYTIGPNSVLKLYQLCYETDGVVVRADVFTTQWTPEVTVKLKFSRHRRILGLDEMLKQFESTYPASSNVGEWQSIRESIISNSGKPGLARFRTFIDALEVIRPARDNQGEWESIKSTCREIDRLWGDDTSWGEGETDKQRLFNKLLHRFMAIRPARDNQGEWAAIRELSGMILEAQAGAEDAR